MAQIVKPKLTNVGNGVKLKNYNFNQRANSEEHIDLISYVDDSLKELFGGIKTDFEETVINPLMDGTIQSFFEQFHIFDYELTEEETPSDTPQSSGGQNGSYANIKNGNVIDTSTVFTTGNKYDLTENELTYLAYMAFKEQGSVEGAKVELSLMANLYEKNKSRYSSVVDYVRNSGWFAHSKTSNYYNPGDGYMQAAREVMSNGNRYVAPNVVEHDYIGDISSISTGSKNDRSAYVPGETIIKNVYGAKYVFVGFAPNGGDPFGYLIN